MSRTGAAPTSCSCIGRQFALHEAVLLLGMLIRRYDLVADPDYRLEVTERLTVMPKNFRLGLRRRGQPNRTPWASGSSEE